MNKLLKIFLCTISLILFTSSIALAGKGTRINNIVVFGDSLSDNGNLYDKLYGYIPKSPPYFEGRFSNGKVWAENLADMLNEKYNISMDNYAYGGLTTVLHNPFDSYLPYTLGMDIYDYLWDTAYNDRTNTLFVFWVGANDYLPTKKQNSDDTLNDNDDEEIQQLTSNVTDKIKEWVVSLINDHGAKNFLIINLPDLGLTPKARVKNKIEILHRLSTLHNDKLKARMEELQKDDAFKEINIQYFDINKIFTSFVDQPVSATAPMNRKDPCWKGGYSLRATPSERDIKKDLIDYLRREGKFYTATPSMNPDVVARFIQQSPALLEAYETSKLAEENPNVCLNPDNYFFWDHLHPTAIIHKGLGRIIGGFIEANFVQGK